MRRMDDTASKRVQVRIIADVEKGTRPEVSLQDSRHIRIKERLVLTMDYEQDGRRCVLAYAIYLLQFQP